MVASIAWVGEPAHRLGRCWPSASLRSPGWLGWGFVAVADGYPTSAGLLPGQSGKGPVKVQAWLASHPRIHLHFTPTYGSWLNLVEVFFSIIERQALRRGDFASVQELMAAIRRFCDSWNQRCRPFTWTKDADQILTKLKRQNTSATDH